MGGEGGVGTDFGYGAAKGGFGDCCILGSEETVHDEWFGLVRFMKMVLLVNNIEASCVVAFEASQTRAKLGSDRRQGQSALRFSAPSNKISGPRSSRAPESSSSS